MTPKDKNPLRLGTRGSALARTQSEQIAADLRRLSPDERFETVIIKTTGDVQIEGPLSRLAGKGFFTKEIEEALLDGRIDLAIHSLKDLPTELPDGLEIGAIPRREDPRDALIGQALGPGSRIGTSSLRRASQLRMLYPGCTVCELRGNLDTRISKVKSGAYDSAVVAAAGLLRLGRQSEITQLMDPARFLPAPGQGALAIEIRKGDRRTAEVVRRVHSEETERCVGAERAFLSRLGSGCQVPVGALAKISGGTLALRGRVVSLDGTQVLEGEESGPSADAARAGERLAERLLKQGAAKIIRSIELNSGRS